MATLKSKRKQEAVVEELTAVAEETTPVEESPYLNDAEQEALANQAEADAEESRKVSSVKMTKAVEVVSDEFNLYDKNFIVTGFADKGSKCQIAVSNGDFDIVITVKDAEKFGIS